MNYLIKLGIGLLFLISSMAASAEPTLDQVYSATKAGRLVEAQSMMKEVIQLHPNSAKAHYVNAEVLARSGDREAARSELAVAEKLDPGLPFANPQSVSELKQALTTSNSVPLQKESGGSWGTIIIVGVIALLLVVFLVRRLTQQNPVVISQAPPNGGYYPNGMPMGGGQPMYPPGGGGMGSGLMGTLATGAALGAGMVAGEALAHRLVDGPSGSMPVGGEGYVAPSNTNADMGGQDFGVSNTGSWNDSSGSSWDSADSGGGFDTGGGSDWT